MKSIVYSMKIVFNIKFVAQTSNIKKNSENIKPDIITSKGAPLILPGRSPYQAEVAGVTFSDSDSAPVPKFLNLRPDPDPAIIQI